jgi:hypothetical protein
MSKRKRELSEEQVDEMVTTQADDDSAWGRPIKVRRSSATAVELPSDLAARAAFFARLHRMSGLEDWLKRVVQERLEMEEAAFAALKRELAAK